MPVRTTPRPLAAVLAALLALALLVPACSMLPGGSAPDPAPSGPVTPAKPAASATGTPEPEVPVEPAQVKAVSGKELRRLASRGAMIVDVRPKEEYDLEHLPEAESVPMSEFTKRAEKWAEDEQVVVYGSKDGQATTAASWLVRDGFTEVYRLKGGIEAWDGDRDGVLSEYRLDEPTVIYIYSAGCSVCAQATPEFDDLKKKYGKKVQFQMWNADEMALGRVRLFSGEWATTQDMENAEKIGQKTSIVSAVPTFYIVEDDPRTYRKIVGLDGLRVLYAWLQEQ